MSKIQSPEKIQDVPIAFINNIVALATSGFGIVVALAWNEAIKAAVEEYITPYLGKSGSVASLFIYAIIITFIAVFIAMQLAQIQKKSQDLDKLIKNETDPIESESLDTDVNTDSAKDTKKEIKPATKSKSAK